jgi:hypothetical protein
VLELGDVPGLVLHPDHLPEGIVSLAHRPGCQGVAGLPRRIDRLPQQVPRGNGGAA